MNSLNLKEKTTVLFDLDGTLLPMELEEFTNTYFALLAKKAAPFGYEPKPLVAAVWKGTKAMVKNDGSELNCSRFWEIFSQEMGRESLKLREPFDDFYAKEFHGAKTATWENPLAKKAVDGLKKRGFELMLATNSLFPAVGVNTRLSWVGLSLSDFSYVTTYENSSYCKPNPDYFGEILEKTGKQPEECLMVGNDADEDLAALEREIDVFLTTDCLINKSGRDLTGISTGTFAEFLTMMEVN